MYQYSIHVRCLWVNYLCLMSIGESVLVYYAILMSMDEFISSLFMSSVCWCKCINRLKCLMSLGDIVCAVYFYMMSLGKLYDIDVYGCVYQQSTYVWCLWARLYQQSMYVWYLWIIVNICLKIIKIDIICPNQTFVPNNLEPFIEN